MDEEKRVPWTVAETEGPSSELYETLADVLRDQEEKALEGTQRPIPWGERHRLSLSISLVLLMAISVLLWASPPAWLHSPGAGPLPAGTAEAGLRMEVYLQAIRVRSFQAHERRLPNSLEEAGDPHSIVIYERLDAERYRLSVEGPGGSMVYESSQSPDDFLGDAPAVLGVRP